MADTLLHRRDSSVLWANYTGITFEVVNNILAIHQTSSLRQTELFQTIISRDPDVIAAIQQRSLSLLSATWRPSVDGRPRGGVREIYERFLEIDINPIIAHLSMFPYFGYSAIQLVYDDNLFPVAIEPIPHRAIDFRGQDIYISTQDGWKKLTDIEASDSKVFFALVDPTDPIGRAIMRPVAAAWVIKHYVLRDWAIYSERLGDPPIIGRYSQGAVVPDSKPVSEYIVEQLAQLKNHAVGAFPDGIDIRMLSDDRFDASRAFSLLVDTIDRSIKRAILTSEATIQTGSEGRGARASDQIRASYGIDTVIEADARAVKSALQKMLSAVLKLHGYVGDEITWEVAWIDELPTMRRIQAMFMLKKAGFQFDEARALREVGFVPSQTSQNGGGDADIE